MDYHHVWHTASAAETQEIGVRVASDIVKRSSGQKLPVICLWGDLGSGKTTFVQGFARGLGVSSRVLSPTFLIVRRLDLSSPFSCLYHLDLYRIDSEEAVRGIGLSDMLADQFAMVVVEWPERLGSLLPNNRIDIHFSIEENDTHLIELHEIMNI